MGINSRALNCAQMGIGDRPSCSFSFNHRFPSLDSNVTEAMKNIGNTNPQQESQHQACKMTILYPECNVLYDRSRHQPREKMITHLPYEPGVIPTKPSPQPGEAITIRANGLPPYKDRHFSIRNMRHPIHSRFRILREVAIKAMDGRAPYLGPVQLDLDMEHVSSRTRSVC